MRLSFLGQSGDGCLVGICSATVTKIQRDPADATGLYGVSRGPMKRRSKRPIFDGGVASSSALVTCSSRRNDGDVDGRGAHALLSARRARLAALSGEGGARRG